MKLFLAILMAALPLAAQSQPRPMEGGIQSFQLQNGLRVLLLENHQHPLIRLQFRAVWAPNEIKELTLGSEAKSKEPVPQSLGRTSLAPLLAGVLAQCSVGHRSRGAFNRTAEERGLSLRLSEEPDGPVWSVSAGSPEAESAFSLLADAATRPIPEGGDLDAIKLRLIHDLHEQGSLETAKANFLRLLERPDQALEPLTENSFTRIYIEDLQRSISATLRPGRSVLAISGDLNLSQARQLVQLNFGSWNEGTDEPSPGSLKPAPGPPASVRPPLVVPSDRAETSLALPFRPSDGRQRASRDLLSLWLPRCFKPNRCLIRPGASGWRSLILTAEAPESSLRKEVLAFVKAGLTAKDLGQAKALWIADRRSLALHPEGQMSFAARESLLGAEPTEQEIQSVDLAGFNAAMLSWLDLDSARVLVFSGNQVPAPKPN